MQLYTYDDQRNAQILNLFIYLLLPYMFRAFFKPIFLQRQVYKLGSGMVSAPGRWHHTEEIWTTVEAVHLPLKTGLKKARNM
jgi:hypothetical protein